jgi:hypothetical protein
MFFELTAKILLFKKLHNIKEYDYICEDADGRLSTHQGLNFTGTIFQWLPYLKQVRYDGCHIEVRGALWVDGVFKGTKTIWTFEGERIVLDLCYKV